MTHIPVTLFTAGILGLLGVLLSCLVSFARFRTNVLIGDGAGTPQAATLLPAIRAHGNFAEHVPLALILLGFVELSGASHMACEIFGGLLILSRIAHGIGMYISSSNPLRAGGALLSWAILLGLAIEALRLAA